MTDKPRWFQTTAIDYPNSRPHIGTAFEKLGADVQARYRRMEGYDVFFLMGNDENTLKVADRAKSLGQEPQAYCDDMARQFQEVWKALDISHDTFIQTSHERHKQCCRKFVQKVYDNGYIYKGSYEGWYCPGCEEFKSDKVHAESGGLCPNHKRPLVRRSEPCWFFKLSAFKDRLLEHLKGNPEFVQPESRRNEMIGFIEAEGLQDLNISRHGEEWGIKLPFDPEFTIYVWFDALLTYITGIGYGDDEATFRKHWPADVHFIGKDITRFHTHIWPAMLWAAGEEAPRKVFSHGFVYVKNEEAGTVEKISKSLGNVIEPMEVISKFSADAFRYYFLRECPFPSDGEFSWTRFAEVYNSELANSLGNTLSRCTTLILKNFGGVLPGTNGYTPSWDYLSVPFDNKMSIVKPSVPRTLEAARSLTESCNYNQAIINILLGILSPTNQYLEFKAPWKLVKTDKEATKEVLFNAVQSLRAVSILLKPFIPKSAEAIYTSFNFPTPWAEVKYADAAELKAQPDDLRITAELIDGKVKPLFPRIG
ncbi:methionine--tRNA ligase [Gemmata sp. JC717]|uniref:methionine--tRNA ligase n=1 Tax=Gemmata algarum TaxID=2975278 RepID=UPI0021BAA611|nr:methionine--tRNA ligase [Gemmata algarum]MDY3551879.1 methionine--tRNA ligase [Gemmata algarum]